ncbi:uncharacterized protein DS421_3g85970 [Arachis hypogaea]|nr:uncharacterized protein DS421_3g85970 [Arachis hypogaea]
MYRRRDIHGDSIYKAQLKDFWDQISYQSFDSKLRTVFDMVDKDADGRITKEEIKETICLSATTNKPSSIQQQAKEYTALIMEELDPEEIGFIMVMVAASFIGALVYAIAAVFVVYSAFISVKVSNRTSSPGSVHIDNLDKTDFSEFIRFYDFAFFMCRENGQKNISISRAVTVWKLVLAGNER